MSKIRIYLTVLLLPLGFMVSCSSDDDAPVSIEGTWLLQNQELEILVNGLPISSELLEQFGLDASDLEIPEGSSIELIAGGELKISSPGEAATTGTWSLSADGKTLSFTQEGESLDFEVLELTQNNLNLTISEIEQVNWFNKSMFIFFTSHFLNWKLLRKIDGRTRTKKATVGE